MTSTLGRSPATSCAGDGASFPAEPDPAPNPRPGRYVAAASQPARGLFAERGRRHRWHRANIAAGRLHAVGVSATSFSTGQSVTWVQGSDVSLWQRPQRRAESTFLTVDHVMASAALPLLFPAVRVRNEWYGDGGIRMTAPLSPALHLRASTHPHDLHA